MAFLFSESPETMPATTRGREREEGGIEEGGKETAVGVIKVKFPSSFVSMLLLTLATTLTELVILSLLILLLLVLI